MVLTKGYAMFPKRCITRLIGIMLIILTSGSIPAARAQAADSIFQIPGLMAPVTIHFDAFGIPQIYAETAHDLFLAQGFVHAAQRWWQMEWIRHQGAGRLSEITGAS